MKRVLIPLVLLIIIGGFIAYYYYTKPIDKTSDVKTDKVLTAETLYKEYESDETIADQKYLNKVIEVSGTIKGALLDDKGMVGVQLEVGDEDLGIICEFEEKYKFKTDDLPNGNSIKLKCFCTGKLMDVVLNRCVIVQ